MTGRWRLLLAGLLVVLVAAAAAQPAGAKAPKRQTEFYVALGDSYAVGYQDSVKHTTRNGYVNQLVPLAAKRGYRFKLLQLGCGGATTESMLAQIDCPAGARAPGAPAYPHQTQTQAAVAFISKHRGHVGLVTVSIGGNNIDACIALPDPLTCVAKRMPAAIANLTTIVKRLRAAGGKRMMIIGSTYPDVALGAWVRPDTFGAGRFDLATDSLTAFARYINPGLKKAYGRAGAKFVDVTAATGAYGPFVTRVAAPYGRIPVPVAEVCRLTFFCNLIGIHMTTAGCGIIARLEAALLPRLPAAKPR
jgi:lysophospholipase L1-like esterase